MAEKHADMRVLSLASPGMREQIGRQLRPIGVTVDFIGEIEELSRFGLSRGSYPVAIMPASLPDNGWWELWGELALLDPRPEILVYAHTASFQFWSGVLELGGFDILVEPFTEEELQLAVLRAAKSFEQRRCEGRGEE